MPTNYLLDTNAISVLALGDTTAWTHLRGLSPSDELYTCFIVVGEWEYGIRHAQGAGRQAQIRAAGTPIFTALTTVWESSPGVASEYGKIHAALRAAGHLIPTNDIWIAAVAAVHDATIITSDPHFQHVPGIRLVDWTRT